MHEAEKDASANHAFTEYPRHSLRIVNEDRYTYQTNLLNSASVYSVNKGNPQNPLRIMPKILPTKQRFAFTSVPSPISSSMPGSLPYTPKRSPDKPDSVKPSPEADSGAMMKDTEKQGMEQANGEDLAECEAQDNRAPKYSDFAASKLSTEKKMGPYPSITSGCTEEIKDNCKGVEAELNGTAEKKFIVPNIRSILQSSYCQDMHDTRKMEFLSVQATPKNEFDKKGRNNRAVGNRKGSQQCRTSVMERSGNSSIILFRGTNDRSLDMDPQSMILSTQDQMSRAQVELEKLRKGYEEVMRKKQEAEKVYVQLAAREDELAVAKEKETGFMLKQEEAINKLAKEKKSLLSQQQGKKRK